MFLDVDFRISTFHYHYPNSVQSSVTGSQTVAADNGPKKIYASKMKHVGFLTMFFFTEKLVVLPQKNTMAN